MCNKRMYIRMAATDQEFAKSAALLSQNEPWVSLGRTYDYTMGKVRDSSGELYVAYCGDEIAGCILLEMHGNLKGFIRSFCVDPQFQGLGIGSKILSFAETLIFKRHPNVFVFAASFNEGAVRFYKLHGYEHIGTFRDYVAAGSDELLFRKTTGPSNDFLAVREETDI